MVDLPDILRAPFIRALEHYISQTQAEESNLGLLLVDLANLSKINHYYGYQHGDGMLSMAYERLLGVSKLPDTVFRLGSHHFAFILPGLTNPGFIALAINKVSTLLGQDTRIGEDIVHVDVNIGIGVGKHGDLDAMSLLSMAETSLAHIRAGGEHQIHALEEDKAAARQDFQL